MRIKTITCHDVYNVGASLQAYALAAYLRKCGHEVEIINYKPDYLSNHFRLFWVNNPAYNKPVLRELYIMAKLPERVKASFSRRKAQYDSFTKNYLPVTQRRYSSNEELKHNLPEADVFFAGSDQIWNALFPNGKDPAFYLDFVPNDKVKASYAASFATETVPKEWENQIRQWISKLDYLSVRESSGLRIIDEMNIDGAVQVLDPVFLLDADEWISIESSLEFTEPYLLLYDFDNNSQISQFAQDMARKNGWKIYSILSNPNCDRCFNQEGPRTFISLVHHAEFVISNSFHATAFSIIFHKQFLVFNRNEEINTRMRDLTNLLGIEGRCGKCEEFTNVNAIDYSSIQERVSCAVLESKRFIERVLRGKND